MYDTGPVRNLAVVAILVSACGGVSGGPSDGSTDAALQGMIRGGPPSVWQCGRYLASNPSKLVLTNTYCGYGYAAIRLREQNSCTAQLGASCAGADCTQTAQTCAHAVECCPYEGYCDPCPTYP